jgi:hypothetical protein
MTPASAGKATVIVHTLSGEEAKTTLAQAHGYRRIAWLMLNGTADRDPEQFVREVRHIMFEQAQEGA